MKLKVDENVDALPSGIFKVVGEQDLERCTSGGWKLVYILQEEQLVTTLEPLSAVETEQRSRSGYHNVYSTAPDGTGVPPGMRAVSQVIVRNRYVLVQDEQSVVVNAGRRIADVERLHNLAEQKMRAEQKAREEAVAESTKQAHELARLRADVERAEKALVEARRTKGTMENDIGAIREAIGAQKMKEILGR